MKEVVKISGKKPGKASVIMAGVHGNERCGIEAFRDILPELEIEKGSVIFIYGNPRAIRQNVRFVEENLNRLFVDQRLLSKQQKDSYEYKRAQVLRPHLDEASALLDIHATLIPESEPFAISESSGADITKYLPFEKIVSGLDEVEPGGTDYYMNKRGAIGVCVECGYIDDPGGTQLAKESIYTFLSAQEHISLPLKPRAQTNIQVYDLYKTKTAKFSLSRPFENFEFVQKGDLIGVDGGEEVRAKKDSIILFAHSRNQKGEEAFILGEQKSTPA